MIMDSRELPKTLDNQPYWAAIDNDKLILRKCRACDAFHHYPRPVCPFCFSSDTTFQEAAGIGVIYTFSVMRRAAKPYVIAYVTLPEGISIMTNIVDCDPDSVRIGAQVKVVFRETESGQKAPMFAPV